MGGKSESTTSERKFISNSNKFQMDLCMNYRLVSLIQILTEPCLILRAS